MLKPIIPLFFLLSVNASAALIRHYTFDVDFADSAGAQHGTLIDVGTTNNSGITQVPGEFLIGTGALNLSEDRDFIDIPSQTINSGNPYSIAFWAKRASLDDSWNMIIGQRDGTSFFIALHENTGLRWRSVNNTATRQADFPVADDVYWHHHAITASAGGTLSYYLDGMLIGAETNKQTGFIFDTIGEAYTDGSDFDFAGQIDDVHIYDEEIDAAAVVALRDRATVDRYAGLIRYYPFDTDFNDQVSTNHGSLVDVDTMGNTGVTTNPAEVAVGSGALDVSADRDYIAIPSLTFSSGTPYSIAFWAQKAPGDTGDAALWDMAIGQRGGTSFFVGLTGSNTLRWRSNQSSATREANFTATSDFAWHHYALVAEGQSLRFYRDGALSGVATNLQTGFIVDTIGEAYIDTRDFDFHGQIDEVHIYDRAIGEDVVAALYDLGGVPEPVDYDVYLLAGQSNMDGRGKNAELTGGLAVWNAPQEDVRIYYVNPVNAQYQTGWTTLQPGLAVAPGYSGALPSPNFGFELSFARTLADRSPDRRIALIKVSRGGTNLHTQWHPNESGNTMWQAFTNFVPQALQTLTNAQDTATLKGMIWHQGESDANNADFEDDLTLFIDEVRLLLAAPTLPFAPGELETYVSASDTDRSYQNNAMAAVSASDPYTGLVSSTNLVASDGVHFDTADVITYGIRYADRIQDIDADALPDDWERANLMSITNSAGGASEDWDADGSSDAAEFRAGTDPDNAADVLRVIPAAVDAENRTLTWPSVSNRVYRILTRSDFDAPWNVAVDNIPATPPENSEPLPGSGGGSVDYYRLELVSP